MNGAAQVILIRKDGALVLQLRDNKPDIANPGMVSAFGGQIEQGETPLQAACREINEETNLDLSEKDLTLFGFYQKTKAEHGEDVAVHYFTSSNIDDSCLQVYEGQGFVVVQNLQEAAALNASPLLRQVLLDYYQN